MGKCSFVNLFVDSPLCMSLAREELVYDCIYKSKKIFQVGEST